MSPDIGVMGYLYSLSTSPHPASNINSQTPGVLSLESIA